MIRIHVINTKNNKKTQRRSIRSLEGSTLVFALLVLSIILVTAVTAAGVALVDKKSSIASARSSIAFQIADGAAEIILQRVYKNTDDNLSDLAGNLPGSASCSDGIISGSLPQSSGTYRAIFYDNDGQKLQCSGAGYGTYAEWRPLTVRMVSEGRYGGTTRAIQLGVKP